MSFDPAKFRTSAKSFLVPSVRDIIFIFLFWSLLAGTLSNRPLADPDIGWHIRTGERILDTRSLPRTDPYSSTMQGRSWFAWEWLYDLILGVLYRTCGLNGVVWLCALIVATTFTLLLSQLLERGTGLLLSIALMLLAEAASTIHLFARPHIVSWLLTLLWFIALECWQVAEQGTVPRWLPWFFPVSMLLWVNLHGGWIFGLALLAIYTLTAFVESMRTHDPFAAVGRSHRARALAKVFSLSLAATFVNPFGWSLHVHIYRYLSDRYLMNHIAEFASPDFHGWAQRCFGIILLLTLIAMASRRRHIQLQYVLVVLLTVYAGLFSSRNIPVASMLLVLIIGPLLWESLVSLATNTGAWGWMRSRLSRIVEFSNRMEDQELQLRGHIWPVACAVGALLICLQGGWLGSRQLIHAHFDPKAVPIAAVDFLSKQSSADPIFSTDSWGGYIIYRLYPQRQVVIDDRHDLYGTERVREILILMHGEPGWQEILDKWQLHLLLLPVDSTLANLLRELPNEWQMTYQDNVAIVFTRK